MRAPFKLGSRARGSESACRGRLSSTTSPLHITTRWSPSPTTAFRRRRSPRWPGSNPLFWASNHPADAMAHLAREHHLFSAPPERQHAADCSLRGRLVSDSDAVARGHFNIREHSSV